MGDKKHLSRNRKQIFGAIIVICLFLSSTLSIMGAFQPGNGSERELLSIDNGALDHITTAGAGSPSPEDAAISRGDPTDQDFARTSTREVDINNWSMFMGNNQNHGYSTATITKINKILWWTQFEPIDDEPVIIESSPVVYGDQVFVCTEDHKIYSLDKMSGTINWEVQTDGLADKSGGPIGSTPTIVNDRLYVGSVDDYLYCFDATPAADGVDEGVADDASAAYDLIWYFKTNGDIYCSPKVVDDTVIIGCDHNDPVRAKVYALNATDGAEIWNYTAPVKGKFQSTPAIENDIVYIGFHPIDYIVGDHTVYAFNLTTGAIKWNATTSNGVYSAITIVNDKLLLGDWNGKVYALFKNNGTEAWSYSTGGPIESSAAVDLGKDLMYIGSNDGDLYAFKISTGERLWSYSAGASIISAPVIAKDKVLFGTSGAGVDKGNIYCLKSTTYPVVPGQRLLWQNSTNGAANTIVALTEGITFATTDNGYVYAFANPDLAAAMGEMEASEDAPYVGETLEVTGNVFNNGSLLISGKANFYLFLTLTQGPPVKTLLRSHDVTLTVGESRVLDAQATIPVRDWSIVSNAFITLQIENISYLETGSALENNIDIVSLDVQEYYDIDWTSYGRDNENTGLGDSGSLTNKSIWEYDTGKSSATKLTTSLLHAKARVFTGSANGRVYSILDDGGLDWIYDTGSKIQGTPTLLMNKAGSTIYEKIFIGTDNGKLYALSPNRGTLNWSYAAGSSIQGSPLVINGTVYFGTMSGKFFALDEDGFFDGDHGIDESIESTIYGDQLWNVTLPGPTKSVPAIMNDLIILVTMDITDGLGDTVLALDRTSGEINWSYTFTSSIDGSPCVDIHNGFVYIGCNDNRMYALDINGLWDDNQGWAGENSGDNNNADIIWRYNAKSTIPATGALDTNNGHLIFGTSDGSVIALNSLTGDEIWINSITGSVLASPTIANEYVYVGTDSGILYCLAEFRSNTTYSNTSLIWKYDAGVPIRVSAIADNFATYLATEDGVITKLGAPNESPFARIDEPSMEQIYFDSESIILNASSSYDLEDGSDLTYLWRFASENTPENFETLYNATPKAKLTLNINETKLTEGNYIINLTVKDSYNFEAYNTTNISVIKGAIKNFEEDIIPGQATARCKIYLNAIRSGVNLYQGNDPGLGIVDSEGNSEGGIDIFLEMEYSNNTPIYKVGWYNVSIEYTPSKLPMEYNISRARMFEPDEAIWQKSGHTGMDFENNLIWANFSGDTLQPHVKKLFAPGTFHNRKPTIRVIGAGPDHKNGSKDDTFEFMVEYTDVDKDLPNATNGGYVHIIINNKRYEMTETNSSVTDPTEGKFYNFSILGSDLDPGPNNPFQIIIHDGTYMVESELYVGPNVTFGEKPNANAGLDKKVYVGETFTLDGSGSTYADVDGYFRKWLWDTDDDGDFLDPGGSAEGETVDWTFDSEGTYNITLKVEDNVGNTDTDIVIITVLKKPIKDEDGKDEGISDALLYGSIAGIIILIILIIVLLLYRNKVQAERDRKAFMVEEKKALGVPGKKRRAGAAAIKGKAKLPSDKAKAKAMKGKEKDKLKKKTEQPKLPPKADTEAAEEELEEELEESEEEEEAEEKEEEPGAEELDEEVEEESEKEELEEEFEEELEEEPGEEEDISEEEAPEETIELEEEMETEPEPEVEPEEVAEEELEEAPETEVEPEPDSDAEATEEPGEEPEPEKEEPTKEKKRKVKKPVGASKKLKKKVPKKLKIKKND